MSKSLNSVMKTKQFQNLLNSGLKLVSTDRQLENGSLAFTGKIRAGRGTIIPRYVVTANGAVISNEFVARRVSSYRDGLRAVSELLSKRVA
jgi:hypothetical protein